jgi:hypothetical protein
MTMPQMIQRSITGSPWARSQAPSGAVAMPPSAAGSTVDQRQSRIERITIGTVRV